MNQYSGYPPARQGMQVGISTDCYGYSAERNNTLGMGPLTLDLGGASNFDLPKKVVIKVDGETKIELQRLELHKTKEMYYHCQMPP
jgi:hypothetical protein